MVNETPEQIQETAPTTPPQQTQPAAPRTTTATTEPEPQAVEQEAAPSPDDVTAALTEVIDKLSPEGKQLLDNFLTPEFSEVMGLMFGQLVGNFFQSIANPNIVLVPTDRQTVSQEGGNPPATPIQQQQAGGAPVPQISQPVTPQAQQAATPPPQAPQQQQGPAGGFLG